MTDRDVDESLPPMSLELAGEIDRIAGEMKKKFRKKLERKLRDRTTLLRLRVKDLEEALLLAAVPLEALRAVEMDSRWMAPQLKASIVTATDAMRVAIAKGPRT